MRITSNAKAVAEVRAAAQYYESKRPGLGHEFIDEVEAARSRIEQAPEMFGFYRGNVRCCLVDRFPYGIYYRVLADRIRVIAVRHHRRHPSHGLRRR